MSEQYSFSAYGTDLCLKMSLGLWLVIAFLLRPYAIMIMSLATRQDRMGLINLFYADRSGMALGAIAALPAMLVIYAWIKRKPEASPLVRRFWAQGRALLVASTVLNMVVVVLPLLWSTTFSVGRIGALQLVACGGIVAYLVTSARVRDTFADFPDPPE